MDNSIKSDNSESSNSILLSIKKLLGPNEEYDHFDPDIIMHINSVFMPLSQLGVGPEGGFFISDRTTQWDEFIPESNLLNYIKIYTYLKVKLIFDPPSSPAVIESIKNTIAECDWRIKVAADEKKEVN